MQLAGSWQTAMGNTLTLQADAGMAQPRRDALMTWLQKQPEVQEVRTLEEKESAALLQPWLGDIDVLPGGADSLPLLMDISLYPERVVDSALWQKELQRIEPSARVDDHRRWLGDTMVMTSAVKKLCLALVLLLLVALAITIGLATRMLLAVNAPVVDVLHRIGSTDKYIQQQFARAAVRLASVGAAGGLILAIACIATLGSALDRTTFRELLASVPVTGWHVVALLLLPLLAAGLAWLASGVVVRRHLSASL
jgi:cell division transport system permease protein